MSPAATMIGLDLRRWMLSSASTMQYEAKKTTKAMMPKIEPVRSIGCGEVSPVKAIALDENSNVAIKMTTLGSILSPG